MQDIVDAVASEAQSQMAVKYYRSFPQLSLACYQVSTRDFHWSMSAEEVRLLMLRIQLSRHVRLRNEVSVESFWGEKFNGLLRFSDSGRATFSWETGKNGGRLLFKNRDGPVDKDVVRAICQAIEVM